MGVVERVQKILGKSHLNINEVSRLTRTLYGSASPFFIPHNFYHNLEANEISPHICQVFALSKLTDYSLVDWLAVFGFHLDEIPRLQTKLHAGRTTLITPVTYDKEALVPWFERTRPITSMEHTIPLSRVVQYARPRRVRSIESLNRRRFLYATVGPHDAMACPELVPGSIVRVDPQRTEIVPFINPLTRKRPVYLVEHIHGLSFSYIDRLDRERIFLRSDFASAEGMEYRLSSEAVILGVVDAEMRPLWGGAAPGPSPFRRRRRSVELRKGSDPDCPLPNLVQFFRERARLQFREASEMSSRIAEELGDPRYAVSVGALFEYETTNTMPRHIHKILSLCILHCMDFWRYIQAAGLSIDEAGKDSIPREDFDGPQHNGPLLSPPTDSSADDSVRDLIEVVKEFPLFLRESLGDLFHFPELSIPDVYWVGRKQEVLHPALLGALLLVVDRKVRKIVPLDWKETREPHFYLVRTRDGRYICGHCTVRDGILTVHPHPEINVGVKRFNYEQDLEIVGQVIGVIRLIS